MDRELKKQQLTDYLQKKISNYRSDSGNGGAGIEAVVDWIMDYYATDTMSESLIKARQAEMENDKHMKKLWIDSYVAGSSNYNSYNDARSEGVV